MYFDFRSSEVPKFRNFPLRVFSGKEIMVVRLRWQSPEAQHDAPSTRFHGILDIRMAGPRQPVLAAMASTSGHVNVPRHLSFLHEKM